jgi:hypothetical protein
MADIFLSYSSRDKERITPLVQIFEQQGWSVWWDYKIRVGTEFDEIIEAEIIASRCVVVIWSNASVQSHWVKSEADEGRKRGILAPVLIDNVDIPLGFRRIEAANLTDWQRETEHAELILLLQGITEILKQSANQINQLPPPMDVLPKTQTLKQRMLQILKKYPNLATFILAGLSVIFISAIFIFFKPYWNLGDNSNQNFNSIVQNHNSSNVNEPPKDIETVSIPPEQRAMAIVNIFEEDRPKGRYPYMLNFEDGNIFQYGHSGASLQRGTLFTLIKNYCDSPNAKFKDHFKPYLNRLLTKDFSLAKDSEFIELLKAAAGEDPVMIDLQNQEYERNFWQPSLNKAQSLGIKTPLGIAVVHDSMFHGNFERLKNQTRDHLEGTPITGVDERKWIKTFLDFRKAWLSNHQNSVIRNSVYRVEELLRLVEQGNWELKAPITIRGFMLVD